MRCLGYDKSPESSAGGGRRLYAFQRFVKFAKMTALFSAVWTVLCTATLIGWQAFSGVTDAYRLSSIVDRLKSNDNGVYSTASLNTSAGLTIKQQIADWLLEIPAIVPLLVVAAMLLAFHRWLAVIENEVSKN